MRLIDADALGVGRCNPDVFVDKEYANGWNSAIDILQKAPTIDAVPVKHGEWIHGREVSRDYVGDACVSIRYENWWCSECKYTVDWGKPLWHYCPNCGAKMDGGKDDDSNLRD